MKIFRSLRYTMVALVGTMIFAVCGAVAGYNYYILKISEQRMADSVRETLRLYVGELDSYLETAENYLLSKSLIDEQKMKLKNPKNELELYLAEITIKDDLGETIGNYRLPHGIFVYDGAGDIYLSGVQKDLVAGDSANIMENRERILEEFKMDGYGNWYFSRLGEEVYLLRTFVNNEIYTTGWINIKEFTERLQEISMETENHLLVCDNCGVPVTGEYAGKLQGQEDTEVLSLEGVRYWYIRQDSDYGFSLVVLKQFETSDWGKGILGKNVAAVAILVLGFIILVILFLNKFFMKPLNRLTEAMQRLRQGDFQVKLAGTNDFEEFQMVNETFDAMKEQIEELKIHIYEEKLQKQTAELQYLQIQINPHFLTNCLNLIRNLSILDKKEEVEEATYLLSKYIRYTLKTDTTVSLERELEHVRDYIQLQKMRYGEQLKLEMQVNADLLKERVPCMMIQTFVENAVKHQMSPEEELRILVKGHTVERPNGIRSLYISVSDNGDGFEKEILENLRKRQAIRKKDGEHIGIYNVMQRFILLYGENVEIIFRNGGDGGAVVEVYLPAEAEV